jgi:hypothetical protein
LKITISLAAFRRSLKLNDDIDMIRTSKLLFQHGAGGGRKKPPGHDSVRLDTQLPFSRFRRCRNNRRAAQRFRASPAKTRWTAKDTADLDQTIYAERSRELSLTYH